MEHTEKERKEMIDGLLDVYNDYNALFQIFGDKEYFEVVELVVKHLKHMSSKQTV